MAALLFDALEVLTDNGLGVPVSYVNTGIGLMSDGHFAWMTGRYTVTTATGDSTRTDWVKNILTLDSGNWTLSRNIDFVEAGAFESVSDFTVGIKNTADIRATLQANGVYLGRRRVKYYRATSTDGVTWAFELRWTGVVDDQPFNELRQSLKCVSTSKDIFGTLPTVPANNVTFPLMPKDSQDKMIPIALGRVAYSPLVNVRGNGDTTPLTSDGTTSFDVCVALVYDKPNRKLTLLTGGLPDLSTSGSTGQPGIQFVANDTRLINKYLSVLVGKSQRIRIWANDASAATTLIYTPVLVPYAYSFWVTVVYLAEELDEADGAFVPYLDGHASVDSAAWFFQALDLANTLLASTNPVYQITPSLNQWGTDKNAFKDVSEILNLTSTTNIDSTGHPGASTQVNRAEDSGGFADYQAIVPKSIVVYSTLNWTSSDLPAPGAEAPLLMDRSDGTYYSMVPSSGAAEVTLDVYFPDGISAKSYSEFALLYDFSALSTGTDQAVDLYATVQVQDIYGSFQTFISAVRVEHFTAVNGVVSSVSGLPRKYVNSSGSDSHFFALKSSMDLQNLFSDSKKGIAYKRVRVILSFRSTFPAQLAFKLMEVGFVGKITIDTSTETLYNHIRGEVYGNTMDGRVDATDYPGSVVRVLEYLIRNYDEKALPWLPSHAYVAGDFVRGTADTGHVFVCTVAGTSSGTEPTWTDTVGATYTDGGVTWKEHHEIPIDTASFDSAAGARGLWLVGRTLTDKKDSLEYYQQLLAQSFLLGVTKPDGKVQLKAWLQNTTPLVAFSEANILPGTLGDVVETPVRRLYNVPLIQYDKNPSSGKYNKQIAVTNIEKPAFPSSIEPVDAGTDLGAFTITAAAVGDGTYILTINTTAAHGMKGGDYLELSGNADGYDFALTACISAADSGVVNYITVHVDTGVFTSSLSSSGTLRKHATGRFKWQDYVAGIVNYSTAKDLWQQFHNSYLVTRVANKMPDQLGQCEWYFDIYAQDANGKYIFSNDGGLTPEYDLGDLHAAAGFANALANWTAWQKKQLTLETADTSTFSALGLGDCISFSDAKLTAGSALIGWIHEKTQLPRDDSRKQMERFRFGLTLYPEPLNTYSPPIEIIESGSWPDTITESGSQPDTYTEGA